LIVPRKEFCKRNHRQTEENTYYYFNKKKNLLTRSCLACRRETDKLRELNPETQKQRRNLRYQRLYGVTYDEAEAMAIEQDYKCAICYSPCTFETKGRGANGSFALDHCHTTGDVRGLLCHRCNKVLGLVKDDPYVLDQMIKYL
jgi:Recombination endonuclease VII